MYFSEEDFKGCGTMLVILALLAIVGLTSIVRWLIWLLNNVNITIG